MPPIDLHPLPVAAKKAAMRPVYLAELAERGDVAAVRVLGQWHFSDHTLDALRQAREPRPSAPPQPGTHTCNHEVLTSREVADLFGVDPKTVRRWVNENRIASFRTLGGNHRFPRDQFRDVLDTHA